MKLSHHPSIFAMCIATATRLTLYTACLCLLPVMLSDPSYASANLDTHTEWRVDDGVPSLVVWPQAPAANAQIEAQALELGRPVRKEIAGGQQHIYRVRMEAGEYAHVVVEQHGIDLVVGSFKPDGAKLVEYNSPGGPMCTEAISVIAEAAGDYKFELRPSDSLASGRSYEIRLEGLRQPTSADRDRFAAEVAHSAARQQPVSPGDEAQQLTLLKYRQALALWQAAGDRSGEVNTLHSIGNFYRTLGKWERAREHYERALSLRREMGDWQGEAYTLNDMGIASRDSESVIKALEYHERALQIFKEIGNRLGEASTRHNIGYAYALAGDMWKALESYKHALSIRQAEQDRRGEIMTLNAMSGAYEGLGEPARAVELAEGVARVWREKAEPVNEAIATNNAALIYDEWGDWQKALDYYRRTLALLPPLKSAALEDCVGAGATDRCRVEAAALDNMGALYGALGEPERALELHEKALIIRRILKQPRGVGTTLARIGYAYYLLDEPDKALLKYAEALPILQQVGDKRSQAYTFTLLGMLHSARKEYNEALIRYNEALRIQQELKDLQGQAITLDKMGQAYVLSGKATDAVKRYEQALELWRGVNDPHGEALTLFNLSVAQQKLGRLTQAHAYAQRALGNIESLRTNITSQKLRTSYFTTKQNYYELEINLLMQMHEADNAVGHDLAALAVNERARARGLIDTLAEAQVDIHEGVEPELIKQEQSLSQRLADKVAAARKLTALDERRARERRSVALAKEINDLILQHDEVKAQLRRRSPRYAELKQPRILGVEEIRQLLDDDTLLLEYALGEERSYLWAVSKGEKPRSYVLPKRAEIEDAARHLHTLLTAPEPVAKELPSQRSARSAESLAQYKEASAELSRMILGPVAERLGTKRLLIVSDGVLQYLPFGALPMPMAGAGEKTMPNRAVDGPAAVNSLLAEHDIVELPSASTLASLRSMKEFRKPARHSVAIFADPVFTADDTRIENAKSSAPLAFARQTTNVNNLRKVLRDSAPSDNANISRLPFTRLEARAIRSVVPRGEALEAIDFDASYETATDAKISDYRIIHFATHGLFDGEHPELSGLVLSQFDRQGRPKKYGFLRLSDIYNLKLGADLVVLSACRTGLGKEIKGEGLIGLTRGFMYAGASRVVASLWKVDDEATAELMKSFYEHMFAKRKPPATALREAQKDIARQTRWRHPYYWAAFVLQGDWK